MFQESDGLPINKAQSACYLKMTAEKRNTEASKKLQQFDANFLVEIEFNEL